MERRYTYVLFDLDGTISDSSAGILRCFRLGLKHFGIEEPNEQKLRAVIGPALVDSYTSTYGLTSEQAAEAVRIYREEYSKTGLFENKLYDGIADMFKALHEHGVTIVVATSKPTEFTTRILDHFGLSPYISFTAGATFDETRRSKEDVVAFALENAKLGTKRHVLMVGDTKYDLAAADHHSIDAVGVLYGFGERAEMEALPHVLLAQSPNDVLRFILDTTDDSQGEIHALRQYVRSEGWYKAPVSDQMKEVPQPPLEPPLPNGTKLIKLPDPKTCQTAGRAFLDDVISRKSVRAYAKRPMTLDALSYLLYCTQGFTHMRPHSTAAMRTVPSAGCRHPLDTYLAVLDIAGLERGIYRYVMMTHELAFIKPCGDDLPELLSAATLGQKFAGTGSCVFFWTADMYRCEWRYTTHAHKLVLLDAGHICQNLYLACEEVDAGCCAIAAYDQQKSDALLGLDGDNYFTVYVAPVGLKP